ncbi:hypothetical protein TEK04_19575 [Klenkia sp. LSe6-5]|uniref:Uncharacterized protein n=1 Tax=Klenkia sesuvii TaxID=3103137 RepID=A0ABU8DYM4_9ACTN
MCDLSEAMQLADLQAQILAERQVVGVLAAAGRWPEDNTWPSMAEARRRFDEHLATLPEPPRFLTAEERERAELHDALGVGRGRG